ncbi:hypothetical protein [Actinomadura hibisca]|uniref:hypothetical protein n=1 Tax=Actinomadura hibisca TaxID=68565 RepID=UPI000833E7ED|nr:hypothetical protein [Actinomadura hibisca]
MRTVTDSDRVEQQKLREEFPDWSIIITDRDRWWATRGPLPRDQAGEVADLEDDTADGLRIKLQAVTQ